MKGLKRKVPNGGWGWIIVIGAAMTNMVNQYLISVFGLVFGQQLELMGYGTFGAALVMNVNSMITNFSGFITGPTLKRFSPRTVTLVGVLFSAIGLITSSFSTNLVEVILTYSILTGLGLGLIMPATFMAVNSYFDTRRQQAVGLSLAGTCVGQMLMPHIVTFLLNEYGFRGTTLILGGISLNGIAGSLLFHPVKWHTILVEDEDKEKENLMIDKNPPQSKQVEDVKKTESIWERIAYFFDLDLLKDLTFIHITVGIAIVYTCSISFSMLFPFFLRLSVGLGQERVAVCMTVLSSADVLARVTLPIFSKIFKLSSRETFLIGSTCLALSRSFLAFQTNFALVFMGAFLCGYVRAATVIFQNLVISEYISEEKLPAGLGLNMIMKGIFVLTLGQILGWIRDTTNSFSMSILSQCLVLTGVVISWTIEMMLRRKERKAT